MTPVDFAKGTVFVGGAGGDHLRAETLLLRRANRHGLIAGATGTGKTVTLQTLAESFSQAGVPVVLADVKGDLAGLATPGSADATHHASLQERADSMDFDLDYDKSPVRFWDIWGAQGHPIRTTPAELGPVLLSRLLGLTEAQEGVLSIAFRLADEEGLALLDLADMRSMLTWVGENAKELSLRYGNVATASVGAIQRRLLVLEGEGGGFLFGEPALELADLIGSDASGKGIINVIVADRLMQSPRLYATFLLWLLSELFEQLPEVGDPEKPVVAFFFDEAHLLFDDAPRALIEKIAQVARLIRSKGVSLWFVTQNPTDVPDDVLSQLGNRVQHALRAHTAKDQKALRMAAENYRINPDFDIADAIQHVGIGEAVTSFLDDKGVPGISQRTLIRPPLSRIGPIPAEMRAAIMATSPMGLKYTRTFDRESAQEILSARAEATASEAGAAAAAKARQIENDLLFTIPRGSAPKARPYDPRLSIPREGVSAARRSDSMAITFGKSMARSLGTRAGTALVRGILGTLFRGS